MLIASSSLETRRHSRQASNECRSLALTDEVEADGLLRCEDEAVLLLQDDTTMAGALQHVSTISNQDTLQEIVGCQRTLEPTNNIRRMTTKAPATQIQRKYWTHS